MIVITQGKRRVAVWLKPHVTQTPLAPDSPLLQPVTAGALAARNRVWLAPLTRNRADADGTPNALNVEYYRQRAGAGVVISEGSQPSAVGQGYPNTAGLVTDANEAGWARVAEAVHAEGGVLVAQLMHVGRISHTDTTGGTTPVSSTATPAQGEVFTAAGQQPFSAPRALATDELPGVAQEFADAARRARRAGVDGVELHAANGYLLHQFLADGSNVRTDAYGGSPQARARFVVEVATAVAEAIGPQRVGIRVSPGHAFNDMRETEVEQTYEALVRRLEPLGLLYLHIAEDPGTRYQDALRRLFTGPVVLSTGFAGASDRATAQEVVDSGAADLFAVGRAFLANPDLVERLRTGAPLNEPDPTTFYGGEAAGYTDYPSLIRAAA